MADMYPVAVSRPDEGVLTYNEMAALEQCGALVGMLGVIVADGPTRVTDLSELYGHVHAIQQAIMSQGAARVYPDRFRLLGETIATGQVPVSTLFIKQFPERCPSCNSTQHIMRGRHPAICHDEWHRP